MGAELVAHAERAARVSICDDEVALEALYRTHALAALRAARAVTRDHHDAEDARSEAFVRVLHGLRGRRVAPDRLRPYLLTASRHAAIDVLRRSARVRSSEQLEGLDRPADGDEPGDRMVRAVDAALVEQAFRSLPLRWRTALVLIDVDRRPLKEAGPMMGLTSNGVAQLAVRARAGLRRRYEQAGGSPREDLAAGSDTSR